MSVSTITAGDVIEKGNVFNTAVTANTNIFSSNLSPSQAPLAFFLIYAVFQGAGKLKIRRTVSGTTANAEILNSDTDLTANAAYVFSVPVSENESINVQYSASVTATKLVVMEVINV